MDRVTTILERVFGPDLPSALEAESFQDVEEFDSLAYMELVSALESEFQLELAPDEVRRILSYDGIVSVLAARGIAP